MANQQLIKSQNVGEAINNTIASLSGILGNQKVKDHRYPPRDIKVISQEQNAENSFEQAAFTYSSIPSQNHP